MRILVASDKFKGTLTAGQACAAIAQGAQAAQPGVEVIVAPMADGGEGTVDAVVEAAGGEVRTASVPGPLGEPVAAAFGLIDGGATAVLEMALAAGWALLGEERLAPMRATTFGVGVLMRAALDAGARRLVIGVGGSATTDGGVGMAQALGVRFLGDDGALLPDGLGGGDLARIQRVDASEIDPRLAAVEIDVLCDVDNPLVGPRGAAAVYAPQKGADAAQVAELDDGLRRLASVVHRDLGFEMAAMPGAGASGGLAAGLAAFAGGRLRPGARTIAERVGLAARMAECQMVVTGEGRLDEQSLHGKAPAVVAEAAEECRLKTYAVAGQVALDGKVAASRFAGTAAVVDTEWPEDMGHGERLAKRAEAAFRQWLGQR